MAVDGSSITEQPHLEYLHLYRPTENGHEPWGCMDKRAPAANDTVLRNQRYFKIAGGAAGLGSDLLVGRDLARYDALELSISPHELGRAAAKVLLQSGILLVVHEDCAAINYGPAIDGSAAEPDEAIFSAVRAIDPDMTSSDYEQVVEVNGFMQQQRHGAAQAADVYDAMSRHSDDEQAVPLARLRSTEHVAKGFVSIWKPNIVFDTHEANEAGEPMYAANMGYDLARIVRIVSHDLDLELDSDHVQAANTVRTAAIMAKHLLGPDGQPYPMHRVA